MKWCQFLVSEGAKARRRGHFSRNVGTYFTERGIFFGTWGFFRPNSAIRADVRVHRVASWVPPGGFLVAPGDLLGPPGSLLAPFWAPRIEGTTTECQHSGFFVSEFNFGSKSGVLPIKSKGPGPSNTKQN